MKTNTELLQHLRGIAPSLTWRVTTGNALWDYGTPAHPWGRNLPSMLIHGGNPKGRQTPEHRRQWDAATKYIKEIGQLQTGGIVGAVRK